MRQKTWWLAAGLLLCTPGAGAGQQTAPRDTGLILSSVTQAVTRPLPQIDRLALIVDLSDRRLYVLDGETVIRSYPVAIGANDYSTPAGRFRVSRLIWNPSWVPPRSGWALNRRPEAPGAPGNPMGRVKIFFREPDYYIHGTGLTSSLGRAASHGCIRMRNIDAAEVARILMAHGGAERSEEWFRNVVDNSTTSRTVNLDTAIRLHVRT